MRRIADFKSKQQPVEVDLSIASTTLEELSNKAQEILRREILNLMGESTSGKLSPPSSTALVNYIKLLGELRDKEKEELAAMSDEFLEKIVNGTKP